MNVCFHHLLKIVGEMKMYSQCMLMKKNKLKIAWIPSKFAFIGRMIKIKNNGIWQDGWKVMNVYKTRDNIIEHERNYMLMSTYKRKNYEK